jgi:pimeloyl-ACP methyl ester carboxylesterase
MSGSVNPIELGGERAANPVIADGEGSPVVYLHGAFGQEWPGFLDDLAKQHRVFAPAQPGIEEPKDLAGLDSFWDLILYYDELFDALGVGQVDLIGHSYGGMVAAEFAATFAHRVRKLVLIDPMGLWRDDAPIGDHLLASPERRLELLYKDASSPEVAERLRMPEDLAEGQAKTLREFASLGASSHFIHPIPERGLSKRIHRIRAETLVLWGADDALVPPVYGDEFAARIANATLEVIPDAGHYPYLEQRAAVSERTLAFLAG